PCSEVELPAKGSNRDRKKGQAQITYCICSLSVNDGYHNADALLALEQWLNGLVDRWSDVRRTLGWLTLGTCNGYDQCECSERKRALHDTPRVRPAVLTHLEALAQAPRARPCCPAAVQHFSLECSRSCQPLARLLGRAFEGVELPLTVSSYRMGNQLPA